MQKFIVSLVALPLLLVGCGGASGGHGSCDWRRSANPQYECREYQGGSSVDAQHAGCTAGGGTWMDGACPATPKAGCKNKVGDGTFIQWYYSADATAVMMMCPSPGTVVTP